MAEVLILGCGYTGKRLGRRLREAGHRVTGSTRREEGAALLREIGIRPLLLDLGRGEDLRRLAREAPDVCFHLVPPLETGSVEDAIRALRRAPLEAFVYGSSTSVYGDRNGAWVDENDIPAPDSPSGEARLAAERGVLRGGWTHDCRPRIGRIAGIYGPGRTLRMAIEEGRYHLVEGVEAWSNRIHVEDLVTALAAIWERGENGRIYNLADDRPHLSSEYARRITELAGLEVPLISRAEARKRYSERRLARKFGSKRVSNRRLREDLEVDLRYPSIREGVPAALENR